MRKTKVTIWIEEPSYVLGGWGGVSHSGRPCMCRRSRATAPGMAAGR